MNDRQYRSILVIFICISLLLYHAILGRLIELKSLESVETVTIERYIYTEEKKPEVQYVSLGEFEVTAYCAENYPHICNNGDATKTATGTTPTEGRTIAVDPKIIPYGTEVVINGHTYIAEDTGGAIKGNRIDICFDSHEAALQFGRKTLEVFVSE